MSYIRGGYPLVYVEGNSEDYVFPSAVPDGRGGYKTSHIEDYGKITDSGLVELLFGYWKTDDNLFKEHLLKRLAERLGVKLRKKPLTDKEEDKLHKENMKKWKKENPWFYKFSKGNNENMKQVYKKNKDQLDKLGKALRAKRKKLKS